MDLTHLDEKGQARMVDVSEKDVTKREAVAQAIVTMLPNTLTMITEGKHKKGDVLATARIAGIQAAKKTWELIPMCHPLMIAGQKWIFKRSVQQNCVLKFAVKLPIAPE